MCVDAVLPLEALWTMAILLQPCVVKPGMVYLVGAQKCLYCALPNSFLWVIDFKESPVGLSISYALIFLWVLI